MLLGLVYLVALSHHTPFNFEFVFHLVLLSLTIVGLGGVGYTINDLFDRSQDQIVGKPNIFLNASRLNRFAVIFISILLAIGPWLWLPCNTILIGLLVIELGLFIIYSIPPIRLKEKMWLGVFVDGLYALNWHLMIQDTNHFQLTFGKPPWLGGCWFLVLEKLCHINNLITLRT